jgi:hydroxyethylthiazole kinase-like uncharacterized protein yjeF
MEFPLLSPRPRDSHKGLFGHVGVIGGAPGMVGAALMAGRTALKCGAGRVTLGVLDDRVVVDYAQPELMFAPPENLVSDARLSVLAIGPGLGQSERARALLESAAAIPQPLIIDADGLNLIAAHPALQDLIRQRSGATLLTPHPGEAARLLGSSIADIRADRQETARKIAASLRAFTVLKGAESVIAGPDGIVAVNSTGCPAMASAGMGDVLTGLIAGLIAQGVKPDQALEASVYLHGAAGEQVWKQKHQPPSLCATDLTEAIPQLLSKPGP